MSLSERTPDFPRADHEYVGKDSPEDLQQLQRTGQAEQPQPHSAAPLARGTAKARKAHKGFEKLLSAAGVWEVAKVSMRNCASLPSLCHISCLSYNLKGPAACPVVVAPGLITVTCLSQLLAA